MDEADVRALDEELAINSASSLRARAILRRFLAATLLPQEILSRDEKRILAKVIELRAKCKEPPEGGI